ncbi:hypothetical protein DSM19430T_22840 [Desulfovibrio psychrotolerans]|uniref:Uncharacterized protein n=1 Tax=Desulfovibrio psychrotolerans TaxID=415242 RepID=A0A7J0BV70_9BACT|nr:hypothetical protein DSM19430T_22840 [Desulfovibrio psychrotolerans]
MSNDWMIQFSLEDQAYIKACENIIKDTSLSLQYRAYAWNNLCIMMTEYGEMPFSWIESYK